MNGQRSLCELCEKRGACELETLPGIRTVTCWKFETKACERCKEENPERACKPPTCLPQEVRP